MKALSFATLILIISSCDSPQRTRDPYGAPLSGGGTTTTVTGENPDNTGDGNTGGDSNSGNDGITVNPDPEVTPGMENCNLDYRYYATNIGYFGLCQSENTENRFRIKFQNSDIQFGTCFVPVHVQSDNTSFKLGIAECVPHEMDKQYDMVLTKDRAEEINGVMVLKASAVNAYMQCMSAKVDFMTAYPGCNLDLSCIQAANNYANSVCSQFSQNFANDYKQIAPLD